MLQQAPEGVHPAMSPSQASPGLSSLSRLTAGPGGLALPQSVPQCPTSAPPATAGGWGTPNSRESPTPPLWNVCCWKCVPQGTEQLLTADPGIVRMRRDLMKRRKAGGQRDPPEVYLLVPRRQSLP